MFGLSHWGCLERFYVELNIRGFLFSENVPRLLISAGQKITGEVFEESFSSVFNSKCRLLQNQKSWGWSWT